ncbi:MAG TPA: hypothetical protein VGM29_03445 [Polyangiaceae bacterium]|jgi:hypothetical protein
MRSHTWEKPTLLYLTLALTALGCGERFRPITAHDVAAPADPRATYGVVLEVAAHERYPIVARDDAHLVLQVRSHVDQTDSGRVSVINLGVDPNGVHLWASGYLVHPDGTIHRRLDAELEHLERVLMARLGGGAAAMVAQPLPPPQAPLAVPPAAPLAALPSAWNEPASDQATWGRGSFTCLPLTLSPKIRMSFRSSSPAVNARTLRSRSRTRPRSAAQRANARSPLAVRRSALATQRTSHAWPRACPRKSSARRRQSYSAGSPWPRWI